MNETEIPEPTAPRPALITRMIVNRLPGTRHWSPGVAATVELAVEPERHERRGR